MWKFVAIIVVTVLAVLAAQMIMETPMLQPSVGAAKIATPILMYGGIRG